MNCAHILSKVDMNEVFDKMGTLTKAVRKELNNPRNIELQKRVDEELNKLKSREEEA